MPLQLSLTLNKFRHKSGFLVKYLVLCEPEGQTTKEAWFRQGIILYGMWRVLQIMFKICYRTLVDENSNSVQSTITS